MTRALRSVFLLATLIAADASAGDLFLQEKSLTVLGIADLQGGDVAAARRAAIADAQRNAVESALGAAIESRFTAEQREAFKDGRTVFSSQIAERVRADSAGFITGYDLLEERSDERSYRVRLRVRIKETSLEDELAKLNALLAKVGYPRIVVLASERFEDASGTRTAIERPSIVSLIEETLIARGFPIVAATSDPSAVETASDPARAAEIAAQHGAEIAIVGSALVKQSTVNAFGGEGMIYGTAVISLRTIHVATGKVLTSNETIGKGIGANTSLAHARAVRAAAPKAVAAIIGGLVAAWQHETRHAAN